jgi:hypothetical protein
MKKLLTVVAVAGFLTACNSGGSSTDTVKDSVIEAIDSSKEAKIDSIQDTTEKKKDQVEATFNKTDSANRDKADSSKSK